MSSSTWPGAEVRAAISMCRVLRRQLLGLATLVITAAVIATAPTSAPRHLALVVIAVATAALLPGGLLLWLQHARLTEGADRLILAGYPYAGRNDPTSAAVARRTAELGSAAHRAKLADEWRGLLRVATRDEWVLRQCRYISHAAVRENAATIARIIAALEQGPGDPAAAVRLRRQSHHIPLPCGSPETQQQDRAQFAGELAAIERQLAQCSAAYFAGEPRTTAETLSVAP